MDNEIKKPKIDESAFIAPGAYIIDDVEIGKNCGIWYGAVIRGDNSPIKIGDNSNVQENCVIHCDPSYPVNIGEYVSIGHAAILHGCTIGDCTIVGMGAIILNDAKIGKGCMIGAGALVKEHMVIPDGSLVVGSPAVIKKSIDEERQDYFRRTAVHYVKKAAKEKQKYE